jgi:amino acid transporter
VLPRPSILGFFAGFFAAFGYWASACAGNVTYWVLIMSTIGAVAKRQAGQDRTRAAVRSANHTSISTPTSSAKFASHSQPRNTTAVPSAP